MAIFRNASPTSQAEKPLVNLNDLIFGGIVIISLAVFFFIGRFRASKKQTERDNRINWSQRQFSIWKIILYSLGIIISLILITRLF